MRKGRNIEDFNHVINLEIKTRCPEKWILIDTETGQTYVGNPGGFWDKLEKVIMKNNEN